ncbi:MAG: reverse transcriptase family protein [Myxococcota bacterium]
MAEIPRPTSKQELYDRIRSSSKDEVIVEEMIRLGFWPASTDAPGDPADDLRRIGELERKLQELALKGSRLTDLDHAKAELHARRLAEARARRLETKRRREEARARRAAAWAARKRTEILYLGQGVSTTLGKRDGEVRFGLPALADGAAIARAMGIPVGTLRFLAFHRRVSATTHWRRFTIPKKTGGVREIAAPMPRLKAAQRWVLEHVLAPVPIHDAAHGFVPGRSIVTNAAAHVGKDVVVNFDLKDFFPTLGWVRVRGLFRSLGYSPEAATVFALVCTAAEVDEVEIDGRRWFVHRSERVLPQGSPCSPAITNLVCVRLDQRLTGLARKLGYTYTRYADDLTFSGSPDSLKTLIGAVRAIVTDEGFRIHPDKTRIMRKGGRQEVTGLVVNRRLGVPRELVRRWRAVLHQVRTSGPDGRRFGPSADVYASLVGFASFVRMVEPDKGDAMLVAAREVAATGGWTQPPRTVYARAIPPVGPPVGPGPTPGPGTAPDPATGGGAGSAGAAPPKRRWWEFWKR